MTKSEVDFHVGRCIRHRRRLLGLTQQGLAELIGIRFQQIQKYECGANRVSASRLFELSEAMSMPVQHFYAGLIDQSPGSKKASSKVLAPDILSKKETMDLVRAYYAMGEKPRKHLLDLAKSLEVSAKRAHQEHSPNPENL